MIHGFKRQPTSHGTVTDDGDHERFSHYVPKAKLTEAMVMGTPVTALCGKVWVPSRDPHAFLDIAHERKFLTSVQVDEFVDRARRPRGARVPGVFHTHSFRPALRLACRLARPCRNPVAGAMYERIRLPEGI